MKMNLHCFANLIPIMILALFSNSGLINATEVGKRTDALEASAWNDSQWISAVNAPVVKGHNNGRAADGASWFVSIVKNEQKIVSAKWMTAGLGVYELYVNGKPVGEEFLKPGFTHYAKTKRSFTYDITDIIRTKPNAENMLSVQVTPGWWADKIITPGGYDGMIGKKCAFRGVLELTFSDGGTGEQSGTGIGLSYSKILVELHGGSIGAQDNEETGASFFFELPLRQEPEEIICEPKAYLNELMMDDNSGQPSAKEVFDTTPYTILVVDDNPDMTDFLKRTFEGYFKRIIIAGDGVEALQLVRSHVPDIIVSDVMMPRMNGYKLCKTIKEDINISHIPVILLTARDDRQSQISGYKNGADGYLSKPFEVEMLMELIRNRLKNREYTKKRYLNAGLIPTPEESTISLTDETFLIKLNSIIQENIENSNLGIQFICQEVGLGRSSLYNKLKALTGMGANEYISKLRIEKAITLISGTDMPFSEIAEKTGFTTPSYFSTAFKQYTGETPSQYKERKKKGLADK